MPRHPNPSAESLSIRGKRASVRLPALRRKFEENGEIGDKDRALVRVGVMNTRILVGAEDLRTWDEEELRRGRKRDVNGKFHGPDPVIVPKAVHDEIVRRTLSDAHKMLTENLLVAVTALTEMVVTPGVDNKDKLKAIDMIVSRVMGKEVQPITVGETPRWMQALDAGVVPMSGLKDPYMGERGEE